MRTRVTIVTLGQRAPTPLSFICTTVMLPSSPTTTRKRALSDSSDVNERDRKKANIWVEDSCGPMPVVMPGIGFRSECSNSYSMTRIVTSSLDHSEIWCRATFFQLRTLGKYYDILMRAIVVNHLFHECNVIQFQVCCQVYLSLCFAIAKMFTEVPLIMFITLSWSTTLLSLISKETM